MGTAQSIMMALLMVTQAQAADPKPAAPHQRAAVAKSAPRLTDAQLEADIRARFAKSKIHEDKFQVHVQGGIAKLEGRTDVLQHKGVATRLARAAGAVVNNQIQI